MKLRVVYTAITIAFVVITLVACQKLFPAAPSPDENTNGVLPGLTSYQLQEHALGDDEFSQVFTPDEGLGPVFNQNSCNNCHVGNLKGSPATALTRYGKMLADSVFDSLANENGPDLLPNAIPGYLGDVLPPDANVSVRLIAPTVMGLGLIAAVADSTILKNAYPHDGVSGVPNYVNPTSFFIPQFFNIPHNGQYIGRFGRKATRVALQDQVVFALLQDLGGVTCDYNQNKPYNYLVGPYTGNNVQDPDVSAGFVNHLVMYLRTLAPPPRRDTTDPNVIAGGQLFASIGCTSCHIPTMVTAQSDIAALSNKTFHPYSDFLLHNMGPELDGGIPEGSAKSFQWRTVPLWGVGLGVNSQGGQLYLLHDGRATSFIQAIQFHNGEASARKAAFNALTSQQQQQIVAFLNSL